MKKNQSPGGKCWKSRQITIKIHAKHVHPLSLSWEVVRGLWSRPEIFNANLFILASVFFDEHSFSLSDWTKQCKSGSLVSGLARITERKTSKSDKRLGKPLFHSKWIRTPQRYFCNQKFGKTTFWSMVNQVYQFEWIIWTHDEQETKVPECFKGKS